VLPQPASRPPVGLHLVRTDESTTEVAALADLLGGPAGLESLLGDLNRRARRVPGLLGRAARRAYRWDAADRSDPQWWPQGVATSAEASTDGTAHGRRMLAVTWYAREVDGHSPGARVSFLDLDTLRYRHVVLVVPEIRDGQLTLSPLRVHAGGVVWCGPFLHVAATGRGFFTFRLDDLMRVPDARAVADPRRLGVDGHTVASFGYRYLLPVRFRYRAVTDDHVTRLRYSFLSLDRHPPASLVAGEYGRGDQTTRLVRFPLDLNTGLLDTGEDGRSWPAELDEGVHGMQGATVVDGRWYVTVSHGPWQPGSVYVGTPGRLRRARWAVPMGPEDIAAGWEDELWTVTEHPHRRWIVSLRRDRLDRLARGGRG
jgi:hypothetical protein